MNGIDMFVEAFKADRAGKFVNLALQQFEWIGHTFGKTADQLNSDLGGYTSSLIGPRWHRKWLKALVSKAPDLFASGEIDPCHCIFSLDKSFKIGDRFRGSGGERITTRGNMLSPR